MVRALFAFALVVGDGRRCLVPATNKDCHSAFEAFAARPGGSLALMPVPDWPVTGAMRRRRPWAALLKLAMSPPMPREDACGPDAYPGIDVRTVRRGRSSSRASTCVPISRRRS